MNPSIYPYIAKMQLLILLQWLIRKQINESSALILVHPTLRKVLI